MKIQLRSATYIAKALNCRQTFVDLPEQATLLDLLQELTRRHGQEFAEVAYADEGYPPEKLAVLLNGSSAAAIGGLDIKLKEGDDVLLLPIISGG